MGRSVLLSVQNRTRRVLVGIEAGKGGALKILYHLVDLLRGRVVLRRPGNNAGRIAPLVRAGVGDLSHQMRVATQYRDLGALLTVVVTLPQQVVNGTASAALAMREKLDMHGG